MRLIDVDRLVNDIAEHITVKAVSRVLAITQGQPIVEAIPIDKPFLKMKYKGYTVYKTEWLKEHIEMEYRVIKGISETKAEAIPIEWLKKKYEEADDKGMGIEDWSVKDCFGHVIKEWEKQNEID